MAANSSIEWTDATWNPVRGCTRIGKKAAGRLLDGIEHNAIPEIAA